MYIFHSSRYFNCRAPSGHHRNNICFGMHFPNDPCVVAGPGIVRVRVLREHDEIARIIGPVAQGMKVQRAPHRDDRRRRLSRAERNQTKRAEQNTAPAAVGVRWSEGVGMRPRAVSAGNEGRA